MPSGLWILDPLDGTRIFCRARRIRPLPFALIHQRVPSSVCCYPSLISFWFLCRCTGESHCLASPVWGKAQPVAFSAAATCGIIPSSRSHRDDRLELLMASLGVASASPAAVWRQGWPRSCRGETICMSPFRPHRPQRWGHGPREAVAAGKAGGPSPTRWSPLLYNTVIRSGRLPDRQPWPSPRRSCQALRPRWRGRPAIPVKAVTLTRSVRRYSPPLLIQSVS